MMWNASSSLKPLRSLALCAAIALCAAPSAFAGYCHAKTTIGLGISNQTTHDPGPAHAERHQGSKYCIAHEQTGLNYVHNNAGSGHAYHTPYFIGGSQSPGSGSGTPGHGGSHGGQGGPGTGNGMDTPPAPGDAGTSEYVAQTWTPNGTGGSITVTLLPESFLQVDATEVTDSQPVSAHAELSADGGLAGGVTITASMDGTTTPRVSVELTGALAGMPYKLVPSSNGVTALQFTQPPTWTVPGQADTFSVRLDGSINGATDNTAATIPFQAELKSATGAPLNGPVGVTFNLYTAATGGSSLWSETQPLLATNGLVAASLGSVAPFSDANIVFDQAYYVGVTVNGDAEMTPRIRLQTVPYAFRAGVAETAGSVADGSITTSSLTPDAIAAITGNSWLLAGNASTNGTRFLGTTDIQPLIIKTAGVEQMRVDTAGNVGIGTSTPKQRLHNTGSYYGRGDLWLYNYAGEGTSGNAYIQARDTSGTSDLTMVIRTQKAGTIVNAVVIDPSGKVGVGNLSPQYLLDVGGPIRAQSTVYTSDARFKTNVETVHNALDTVLGLRGVTFDWNRAAWQQMNFPEGRQVGFIAQEVERTLPELVSTDKDGYKSVAYANVVPVVVEAVKEVKAGADAALAAKEVEIQELRRQNAALEQRLSRLEDRMNHPARGR